VNYGEHGRIFPNQRVPRARGCRNGPQSGSAFRMSTATCPPHVRGAIRFTHLFQYIESRIVTPSGEQNSRSTGVAPAHSLRDMCAVLPSTGPPQLASQRGANSAVFYRGLIIRSCSGRSGTSPSTRSALGCRQLPLPNLPTRRPADSQTTPRPSDLTSADSGHTHRRILALTSANVG
jgi:hypothetical protein